MKVETAPPEQPPIIVTLERDEASILCEWLAGVIHPTRTALPAEPAQLLRSLESVLNGHKATVESNTGSL